MPKLNPSQTILHLYNKIIAIENAVLKNGELLKENLSIGKEHHFLVRHGIEGFKGKILNEFKLREKSSPKERLYALVRQDSSLRHPHRKILDFLIDQYDYQEGKFRELHFSRIVKECGLGKNKASKYLRFLVERGYLRKRDDGYRVWYKINE